MHLFYAPEITGNTYELSEEESKHCTRVLRLTTGDILHLTDGYGTFFTGRITNHDTKHCVVEIVQKIINYQPRLYYLHLAVALTKNIERYEWMLEKAVEIGVDEITPLLCEHSERRVWKKERAEKILVSAMKQSLKTRLPKLNDTYEFSAFARHPFEGKKLIAHCATGGKLMVNDSIQHTNRVLIAIGPEGDFSTKEIAVSATESYTAITLGESRLRTETAGILACAAVYLKYC